MGRKVTLGGDRLGAGKEMKVELKGYERSTHDLQYIWKSSISPGTIVPFMAEVALPGDTFDIGLSADILTKPTNGPLFGRFKLYVDLFQVPIRLYVKQLYMNKLGIGRDMSKVYLPQIMITADQPDFTRPIDNQQINPSALLSHLNIRGIGTQATNGSMLRYFNATSILAYYEIGKQYYFNKQEDYAYVIHKELEALDFQFVEVRMFNTESGPHLLNTTPPSSYPQEEIVIDHEETYLSIEASGDDTGYDWGSQILIKYRYSGETADRIAKLGDWFYNINVTRKSSTILVTATGVNQMNAPYAVPVQIGIVEATTQMPNPDLDVEPQLRRFPIENIDMMRELIMEKPLADGGYIIDSTSPAPYNLMLETTMQGGNRIYSKQYSQEGLLVSTYNSDLFNNWLNKEWIDGDNGISAVTAVDTTGGSFTIDEFNLRRKVYNLLNRIEASGGTYHDWSEATYDEEPSRIIDSPVYLGGMMDDLVFQQVISNSATQDQPLGSLGGRGTLGGNKKGGNVTVKVREISYIMGMVRLVPVLDYSQGNKWDTNLRTLNDFHKPELDTIGFQDLITDQMHWGGTRINGLNVIFRSAGKQPAWLNYMTNVNVVRGTLADETKEMWMTLNRRYALDWIYDGISTDVDIADLTTYIDPAKYNYIFADTRRSAENFWISLGVYIEARRKMSAKMIPNL